jgi:hypothetical protein
MKRVILKQQLSEINIDELTKDFVGVQWNDDKKYMIISTEKGYCSMPNDHYPNVCGVWYAPTVKEYVKRASTKCDDTNFQAFAFDDVKELFKWMSE